MSDLSRLPSTMQALSRPSSGATLRLNGGVALAGDVQVRGAKNTLPKNMVAALLTDGKTTINNVSRIRDVGIVAEMIDAMGGVVDYEEATSTLTIVPTGLHDLSLEAAQRFNGISRIPILLCGPMLHRFGKAFLPSLGGCQIGDRSIDFHLSALQAMGAALESDASGVTLHAPNGLRGTRIHLDYPSVGATEQVILAAVLARGETELMGAAVEPEILDLICQLQKMGALISVETDRAIRIQGVDSLSGCVHYGMPDRLESASWACAALATNGRIKVRGARQLEMMAFLNAFARAGGGFEVESDGMTFFRRLSVPKSIMLETNVHPGYMTDWQQPLVTALTQAEGVSLIHETVYEGRLGYVDQLNRMGAKITLSRDCIGTRCRFGRLNHLHSAIVVGSTPLVGGRIEVPDLRAGFSYVIAALVAKGESEIQNISLINRGYDQFAAKLTALGVKFELSGTI